MGLENLVSQTLLTEDIIDERWVDSPFYKLKLMKAKQAGSRYESIAKDILQKLGHTVESPESTDHDCIVDGEKIEIKGSMLTKGHDSDFFSFLQIRPAQDYHAIMFLTIDFDEIHLYKMTKDKVVKAIDDKIIKKQHGGNKASSGTFCYNGSIKRLDVEVIG